MSGLGGGVKKKSGGGGGGGGGVGWGDEEGVGMGMGMGDEGALEELIGLTRAFGERLGKGGGTGGGGGGAGGTGVWRAAGWELGVIGDMLTKALAARPRPPPMGMVQKSGGGAGAEVGGKGMGIATGMVDGSMANGGFGEAPQVGMYSVTA